MNGNDFDQARAAMVSNQLRTNAVTDALVLAAMGSVPRERFLPVESLGVAYRDSTIELGGGRGINPPIATGRLLDAASIKPGEHALVIGAATGYVPVLLNAIGCSVTALEEAPALIAAARANLVALEQVSVVEGPLAAGWPAAAPYDIIYVDGTVAELPQAVIDQLNEGGRLVAAIDDRGVSRLAIGHLTSGGFGFRTFADVETAPLPAFAPAPAFAF